MVRLRRTDNTPDPRTKQLKNQQWDRIEKRCHNTVLGPPGDCAAGTTEEMTAKGYAGIYLNTPDKVNGKDVIAVVLGGAYEWYQAPDFRLGQIKTYIPTGTTEPEPKKEYLLIKKPGVYDISGCSYLEIGAGLFSDPYEDENGVSYTKVTVTEEFRRKYGENALPPEEEFDKDGNRIIVTYKKQNTGPPPRRRWNGSKYVWDS